MIGPHPFENPSESAANVFILNFDLHIRSLAKVE